MPADLTGVRSSGEALLLEIYKAAPVSTGVHLLCISSLKDAAAFTRTHEELFASKTRAVIIMGGVLPFDEEDTEAFLEPDTAQNNVSWMVCRLVCEFLNVVRYSPRGSLARSSMAGGGHGTCAIGSGGGGRGSGAGAWGLAAWGRGAEGWGVAITAAEVCETCT